MKFTCLGVVLYIFFLPISEYSSIFCVCSIFIDYKSEMNLIFVSL